MLGFVIFAVTFAIFLVALILYLYPASRRLTTIPGLDPSVDKEGNLSDITEAGGIHPFLVKLHEKYGPIAGFWFGDSYTVSLGSAELFKEHLKVFDRPAVLFKCLEPLIGSSSIQFANGVDGRQRRKKYDRYFSHAWCNNYLKSFCQIGENLVEKWASLPLNDEHIPLHQYMMALSLKGILHTAFGSSFSEKNVIQFHKSYELVFSDLSSRLTECTLDSKNSHDQRILKEIDQMKKMVSIAIDERRKKDEKETFLDFLLSEELETERLISDCLTYIIGGFHTTGNLITWAVYYLASHPEVQEKVYNELCDVLQDGELTQKLSELKYLNQVIKETLRIGILAPYSARYQDIDVEIGGHIIPKGTPVLHALGVVLNDPKVWPMPNTFDVNHFDPEIEKSRPPLSFSPFGFAGQRSCPAKNFAFTEALVYLSLIFRRFKVGLVEDQLVTPVYSLVSRPEDEIWITLSHRK